MTAALRHGHELQQVLTRLKRLPLPYGAKLAGRVEELIEAFQADYGSEPSASALADFFTILEAVPVREYSSVTLTPEGGWYVEWRRSDQSRLAIEFCDGGLARFILHQSNPRHPDKTDVMTGSTTSDALIQTTIDLLAPWMKRAA